MKRKVLGFLCLGVFYAVVWLFSFTIKKYNGHSGILGGVTFITLMLVTVYIGYLINKKPRETFTGYLSKVGDDVFEPLNQGIKELNRGEIISRK